MKFLLSFEKPKNLKWKTLLQIKQLSIYTLMQTVKLVVKEEREFQKWGLSKLLSRFDLFLGHQDSEVKIKILHFSNEYTPSTREIMLELLMENFKVALVEKYNFEKLDVYFDNISGISAGHKPCSNRGKRTQGTLLRLRQQLSNRQRNRAIIFLRKPRCFTYLVYI